jgi:hypothetical protein
VAQPVYIGANNAEVARFVNDGSSAVLIVGLGLSQKAIRVEHASGSSSGTDFEYFTYNGTQIGGISQSGTTAVSFNTSSDARLKDNIADAPDAGAIIDALRVRSWDWKADGSHEAFGFVAQEEAAVYAKAVVVGDDDPATIVKQWQRDDSKLVPLLVKEVQSLRGRVTTLETTVQSLLARVAALEAKP